MSAPNRDKAFKDADGNYWYPAEDHDALVAALAQMIAVFDHPKLSTPADRAMARIAGRAALARSKGQS